MKGVFIFMLGAVVIYGAFSFSLWEPNPGFWAKEARIIFSFLVLFIPGSAALLACVE